MGFRRQQKFFGGLVFLFLWIKELVKICNNDKVGVTKGMLEVHLTLSHPFTPINDSLYFTSR